MLKIRLKDSEAATSLKVKSIKASMHANSTLIHKTALLNVGYDCDVKVEKKHFIFVVDTSSSMQKEDMISDKGENISRIEAAKEAILDIAYGSDKNILIILIVLLALIRKLRSYLMEEIYTIL